MARKKKKIFSSQTSLTTRRTINQERRIERAREDIANLKIIVDIVESFLEDNEETKLNISVTALTLESYGDARLGPYWWWLHSDPYLEYNGYSDFPEVKDYKWGSYWTGHSKDSERFVLDRAKWVYPILLEEFETGKETLEELEHPIW